MAPTLPSPAQLAARAVGSISALLLLSSCSYLYRVNFQVTLGPELAAREGQVELLVTEAVDVDRNTVPHAPGQLLHEGAVEICCAPDPTVTISAFFDENGDHILNADEVSVSDARGAFVLSENTGSALSLERERVGTGVVYSGALAPRAAVPGTPASETASEQPAPRAPERTTPVRGEAH